MSFRTASARGVSGESGSASPSRPRSRRRRWRASIRPTCRVHRRARRSNRPGTHMASCSSSRAPASSWRCPTTAPSGRPSSAGRAPLSSRRTAGRASTGRAPLSSRQRAGRASTGRASSRSTRSTARAPARRPNLPTFSIDAPRTAPDAVFRPAEPVVSFANRGGRVPVGQPVATTTGDGTDMAWPETAVGIGIGIAAALALAAALGMSRRRGTLQGV